jgi:hypothetical protein
MRAVKGSLGLSHKERKNRRPSLDARRGCTSPALFMKFCREMAECARHARRVSPVPARLALSARLA